MKNKAVTILLLLVVLGIWGYIGLRVKKAMKVEENTSTSAPSFVPEQSPIEDNYTLLLDYEDPFSARITKRKATSSSRPTYTSSSTPAFQDIPENLMEDLIWPEIEFKGIVQKTNKSKAACILSIDGKSVIASIGQEVEGLTLLSVFDDEITLRLEHETKTFKHR